MSKEETLSTEAQATDPTKPEGGRVRLYELAMLIVAIALTTCSGALILRVETRNLAAGGVLPMQGGKWRVFTYESEQHWKRFRSSELRSGESPAAPWVLSESQRRQMHQEMRAARDNAELRRVVADAVLVYWLIPLAILVAGVPTLLTENSRIRTAAIGCLTVLCLQFAIAWLHSYFGSLG